MEIVFDVVNGVLQTMKHLPLNPRRKHFYDKRPMKMPQSLLLNYVAELHLNVYHLYFVDDEWEVFDYLLYYQILKIKFYILQRFEQSLLYESIPFSLSLKINF